MTQDDTHVPADVTIEWTEHLVDAVREEGTNPAATTRVACMTHVAMYDAVNGIDRARGDGGYEAYAVDVSDAPAAGSRIAAATAAAHEVLSSYYPDRTDAFDEAFETRCGGDADEDGETESGTEWGRTAAEAVIDLRTDDGADDHAEYVAVDDPDDPAAGRFRFDWGSAHLAEMTPWTVDAPAEHRPDGPRDLDCAAYADAWQETYERGEDRPDRDQEGLDVAAFWRGTAGTARPPGRWILIATAVMDDRDLDVSEAARTYAALGLALADAGIVTWESKRHYGFWRPKTAVHEADRDGNPETEADPDWEPLAVGGSPEYISGLGAFGGAGRTVLASCFDGDDVPFELTVQSGFSADELAEDTRSYDGFDEALAESIDSRILVGNHFRFSLEDGADVGEKIAERVLEAELQPVPADEAGDSVDETGSGSADETDPGEAGGTDPSAADVGEVGSGGLIARILALFRR